MKFVRLRSKKFVFAYLAIFIFVCICAVQYTSNDSDPIQSSAAVNQNAATNKDPSLTRTFGIIYPVANSFYELITEEIEQAAKPYSTQLIVKAPDEFNVEQQIRMIETMIKQKVDGIAISPIDPEALAPHINKAVRQGIPVICFESDAPASERASFIGADPYKEGHLMGEIILRRLEGKGMIIVESGLTTSAHQNNRLEGMLQYLKKYPDIKVLEHHYNEGRTDQALSDLELMIDNHPHFDILVSLDIISSAASILEWKAKGLKRTALAFGLSPEVKEALINGQIYSVVSENENIWGDWIIKQLLDASDGKSIAPWINTYSIEVTPSDLSQKL